MSMLLRIQCVMMLQRMFKDLILKNRMCIEEMIVQYCVKLTVQSCVGVVSSVMEHIKKNYIINTHMHLVQ